MNTASVHANPDDIEQFALLLSQFCQNVGEEVRRISAAFDILGESWIDDVHKRYQREFEDMVPPITRLLENTPDHVNHLLRKAEDLRAFLAR